MISVTSIQNVQWLQTCDAVVRLVSGRINAGLGHKPDSVVAELQGSAQAKHQQILKAGAWVHRTRHKSKGKCEARCEVESQRYERQMGQNDDVC